MEESELTDSQLDDLNTVLNITDYQASLLDKKDQQFLSKYGYLAIYLSGLNPLSKSGPDRAGAWMLSFPDAVRNGLKVTNEIDERADFVKSIGAARLHFETLKKHHGAHTEAAFVLGAVGRQKIEPEELKELEQTLSNIRILYKTTPKKHAITNVSDLKPHSFDGTVSVRVLQKEFGIDPRDFSQANPTLVGEFIPAGMEVRLPVEDFTVDLVSRTEEQNTVWKKQQDSVMNRMKKSIPSPQSHKVTTYTVRPGDFLGRIAQHYGVSVSNLKKWNDLRSDRIDINQKLTIYLKKGKKEPPPIIAKAEPEPEVKLTTKEIGKFTIYEVQAGDTLWAISKRFDGVKPEQIMEWNGIGEDLSIGQKLKIKMN